MLNFFFGSFVFFCFSCDERREGKRKTEKEEKNKTHTLEYTNRDKHRQKTDENKKKDTHHRHTHIPYAPPKKKKNNKICVLWWFIMKVVLAVLALVSLAGANAGTYKKIDPVNQHTISD